MFPMVEVEVQGLRGRANIPALLDTGFSGYMCLPTDLAVELGLQLAGTNVVEYADGRQKRELWFKGKVALKGVTRTAQIYLTDSDEALIGMKMLLDCRILIDVSKNHVRINRIAPKK
ncbi:MAG: aspartyl protease family protein [Planctomycetes bacterium]|nr:aspartyl protease family protein [Planctomycetota bacterium]